MCGASKHYCGLPYKRFLLSYRRCIRLEHQTTCIRVQMTAFGHPCWLLLLGCSESHKRVLDLLVLVVVLQSPESPSQQALPTHTGQPVNTVNKSTKPQLCIHNDLCFVLPGLTGNIRGNSQVDFVNQGKP